MLGEMTGSGAAGDYGTPYAFGKKGNEKAKGKKQAFFGSTLQLNQTELNQAEQEFLKFEGIRVPLPMHS